MRGSGTSIHFSLPCIGTCSSTWGQITGLILVLLVLTAIVDFYIVTQIFIVPPRPQLVSSLPKSFQPLLLTPTPSLHYQTLSDAEITNYHERGQCFYCNQKFSCNHCCQGCYLVLVVEEDDDPPFSIVSPYDILISYEEEPQCKVCKNVSLSL